MHDSPWGGSEELWSQAAIRLKHSGHQVYASVGYRPQLPRQTLGLMKQGIQVQMHASRWAALPRRIWNKASRFDRRFHAALRRSQPDLVVISQGFIAGGFDWARTCREAGIPYVVIVHCNSEHWWFQHELNNALEAYRAARVVYCVSQSNLDLLSLQLGEALPNAAIVRNPYNVQTQRPLTWPQKDDPWKLACVARLDPAAKGQDILFQIMAQPEWRERPVELNLYGQGPEEPAFRKIISKLALANVNLRGHIADVASIWDENHILVLPSRYEGLPIALVEAMWCGRTAVVTDIGGNTELLDDGRTGFFAEAPTIASFELALERAWQRRLDWKAMGIAARQAVEAKIPLDPIAVFCKQLESVVLESRTSSRAGAAADVGATGAEAANENSR
jgi:glycosyltransferase involved in cell wall biosynthesis